MRPTDADKADAEGAIARKKQAQKVRAILRARRAANPNFDRDRLNRRVQATLAAGLRSSLIAAIRTNAKRGAAVRNLGCTIAALRFWIAAQFQQGMSWDNYGTWQIDHKTPLARFDLTIREHVLAACHWSNLRPLWKRDNQSRGSKTLWQPEMPGLAALVAA